MDWLFPSPEGYRIPLTLPHIPRNGHRLEEASMILGEHSGALTDLIGGRSFFGGMSGNVWLCRIKHVSLKVLLFQH